MDVGQMFARLLNEMKADREETKANQAKAEANLKTRMLEVMERQIGSLAANMKADKEERKVKIKAERNAHVQKLLPKCTYVCIVTNFIRVLPDNGSVNSPT
jgi:hypothetical protein